MIRDIEEIHKEYNRIKELKDNGNINRYGLLFSTDYNNYYYDAGTGKVLLLDDDEYYFFDILMNESNSLDFILNNVKSKIPKYMSYILDENLFRLPEVKSMKVMENDIPYDMVANNAIRQLVLEVTEACNFRCKYCIYNEDYEKERNFGTLKMDFSTAKKAIDYLFNHSQKKIAITFYGGEPLVNFELIKKSINYALDKNILEQRELTFSLTSNLSLMTQDIADYFSTIPNLSILASIDGPEEIHNKARVYKSNKATFQDVMRGLKIITKAFEKTENAILINSVLVPPYSFEKLDQINNFFANLDCLPKDIIIQIQYALPGSYDYNEWEKFERNSKYYIGGIYEPLIKWQMKKLVENKNHINNTHNIYYYNISFIIKMIIERMQVNSISKDYSFSCNGCCVPGVRKMYVTTKGRIKLCERIGESPYIGDIENGIDIGLAKKIYIEDYINDSIPDCKECWAINLCRICYSNAYKNGFSIEEKRKTCFSSKQYLKLCLICFYKLYEEYPELIEKIYNKQKN